MLMEKNMKVFKQCGKPEAAGRLGSALYLAQTELFISLPLYQHQVTFIHTVMSHGIMQGCEC